MFETGLGATNPAHKSANPMIKKGIPICKLLLNPFINAIINKILTPREAAIVSHTETFLVTEATLNAEHISMV